MMEEIQLELTGTDLDKIKAEERSLGNQEIFYKYFQYFLSVAEIVEAEPELFKLDYPTRSKLKHIENFDKAALLQVAQIYCNENNKLMTGLVKFSDDLYLKVS